MNNVLTAEILFRYFNAQIKYQNKLWNLVSIWPRRDMLGLSQHLEKKDSIQLWARISSCNLILKRLDRLTTEEFLKIKPITLSANQDTLQVTGFSCSNLVATIFFKYHHYNDSLNNPDGYFYSCSSIDLTHKTIVDQLRAMGYCTEKQLFDDGIAVEVF